MSGRSLFLAAVCATLLFGCTAEPRRPNAVAPVVVSERVKHDSDDPAIWLHPTDPSRSLILGTDKDLDGALFAFGLDGKVAGVVPGLLRPNNVDVEYGLELRGGARVDVAVVTERLADKVRVFRLPDLAPLDCGGIDAFVGEAQRAPMGIALYKRPRDGAVFAIVGRKAGPTEGYLWQYRLEDDGTGCIRGTPVRAFGGWSGRGEIEAIAVDDTLSYVYYTDEWLGVRKYGADPDARDAGRELALFGSDGFARDREGIALYNLDERTGYILVSDQQANQFHVFAREGSPGNPNAHPRLKVIRTQALGSDGSDATSARLGPAFPAGLFVAMSEGGTFQLYSWADLAGAELRKAARSGR